MDIKIGLAVLNGGDERGFCPCRRAPVSRDICGIPSGSQAHVESGLESAGGHAEWEPDEAWRLRGDPGGATRDKDRSMNVRLQS